MGINVGTFTVTVPGHLTRRSKGSDTELEITGEQGRYLFETLSEVTHLFPPDPTDEPTQSSGPTVVPGANISTAKAG